MMGVPFTRIVTGATVNVGVTIVGIGVFVLVAVGDTVTVRVGVRVGVSEGTDVLGRGVLVMGAGVVVGEPVTTIGVTIPLVGVIAGELKIVLLRMTTPELAEYAVLNSLLFSITTLEGLTPLATITLQR